MNRKFLAVACVCVTAGCSSGVDCDDVVATPGGYIARACVHEIPDGAEIAFVEGGGTVVSVDGKVVATYEPCACQARRSTRQAPVPNGVATSSIGAMPANADTDAGGDEHDASTAPYDACFSPTENLSVAGLFGCPCEENIFTHNGYCVEGNALVCEQGRWIKVVDGPCLPPGLISPEMCEARGGQQLVPFKAPPLLDFKDKCADGSALLGAVIVESLVEARCCKRP